MTLEQGALSLANPAAAGTGVITFAPGADATLTNGVITLTFDGTSGGITRYANAATGLSLR